MSYSRKPENNSLFSTSSGTSNNPRTEEEQQELERLLKLLDQKLIWVENFQIENAKEMAKLEKEREQAKRDLEITDARLKELEEAGNSSGFRK